MIIQDRIKEVLDSDCFEKLALKGGCTKVFKAVGGPLSARSGDMCWCCHNNDDLAKRIWDTVTAGSACDSSSAGKL